MEQWTASKLGKEYIKVVYCHTAYLTSMQATSCKMPGYMTYKLESRLWEKYQQPQICRYHPNGKSKEELKSLLMKVKEESKKAVLKLNIQKSKIQSHHFIANRWGKTWKQ